MGAHGHMNISVLGGWGPECEGQPLRDSVQQVVCTRSE